MEQNSTKKKACISCKLEIPEDALLCHHCSSFQKAWKNHLRYISSVIAVFTVFGASLVFIITKIPEFRKAVFWKDNIRTISFNSSKSICIVNDGDGSVLLSHLVYRYSAKFGSDTAYRDSINNRFNKLLEPEAVFDFDFNERLHDIIENLPDSEWESVTKRAFDTNDNCFSVILIYKEDPRAKQLFKMQETVKKKLRSLPASATLYFYSFKTKRMLRHDIPVVAYVGRLLGEDCKVSQYGITK